MADDGIDYAAVFQGLPGMVALMAPEPAGVMGLLRSELSAASRVADGPARALEVGDLYARSVDGAENTIVVTTHIDWDSLVRF
jgi:hypothetical protein